MFHFVKQAFRIFLRALYNLTIMFKANVLVAAATTASYEEWAAALKSTSTSASCEDKVLSCRSLAQTYCGTKGLPSGTCLRNGCPEDTYNWELKDFFGGQCHYHCTCKSSAITV